MTGLKETGEEKYKIIKEFVTEGEGTNLDTVIM